MLLHRINTIICACVYHKCMHEFTIRSRPSWTELQALQTNQKLWCSDVLTLSQADRLIDMLTLSQLGTQ